MKPEHIFPYILICLNCAGALVYLFKADVRMTLYWFCAAMLTSIIVFLPAK